MPLILLYKSLVDGGVEESRIGIAVHQGVDLELSLVERVRRWMHHVAIDDFTGPRVQTHLQTPSLRYLLVFGDVKARFPLPELTARVDG